METIADEMQRIRDVRETLSNIYHRKVLWGHNDDLNRIIDALCDLHDAVEEHGADGK